MVLPVLRESRVPVVIQTDLPDLGDVRPSVVEHFFHCFCYVVCSVLWVDCTVR